MKPSMALSPSLPERNTPGGDPLELLALLCRYHSYSGKYPVKTTFHAASHVRMRVLVFFFFYPC